MGKYLLDGTRTARMRLRLFSEKDFEAWLPFYDDPESTRFWEGLPKVPREACRQQFDRILTRYREGLGGMNALIDRESGKLLGMCGLLVQQVDGQTDLEIGYSLLPFARGLGYATEAALHCRDQAFANHWADTLISIIHRENTPSMRVARNLGMRPERETRYKENPVLIFRIRASELH